eukprot:COSAG02_NODE_1_length_108762_cov_456.708287_48_plen_74_part_00
MISSGGLFGAGLLGLLDLHVLVVKAVRHAIPFFKKRYRVAAGIDQPLRDPSPYATPLGENMHQEGLQYSMTGT